MGDTSGSIINLKTNAATTYTNDLLVATGSLQFQIGAYAGQTASLQIGSTAANQLGVTATGLSTPGLTVANIDVTSATGASDAIRLLDAATSEVSAMEADLGAFQSNVLQSNVNSLTAAQQNIPHPTQLSLTPTWQVK